MTQPAESVSLKIAMCAPGEVYGGVETQLIGLCRRLRDITAYDPLLVLFHDLELAARAREAGLLTEVLKSRHRYDPGAARTLADLVTRAEIDVLHVHGYRAMITAAVAGGALGVPVVKTEHGLPEPGGGLVDGMKSRLNRWLDGWATRRADATVCYVTADIMSRNTRVHRDLPRKVVYNGIEPLDRAATTRPVELEPEHVNVGIVGRVSTVKGISYALQALAKDDVPERIRLHVIGTGPLTGNLQQDVVTQGLGERVRFHGFRRDIYDWLAHVDALLMPSLHEGLPYTLLEAMSLGTPVIASRVGGLAEVLSEGETGLLVDVGDVDGIARALTRLAEDRDLAATLGRAAAASQRADYTLQGMTEAYLETYAEAIG